MVMVMVMVMDSLLLTSQSSSSLLFYRKKNRSPPLRISSISRTILNPPPFLSFSTTLSLSPTTTNPPHRFSSIRLYSSVSGGNIPDPDPLSGKPPVTSGASSKGNPADDKPEDSPQVKIVDEWGEKAEPETAYTKLTDVDPPKDEDEWGKDDEVPLIESGNGSAASAAAVVVAEEVDMAGDLKRCLVDTVYGTNFGFDASAEVRAEVMELVNQLEAANPTPAPTEAAELLDGNWVLVYTAFSELLPLLAAGRIPLLKVDRICQSIDTSGLNIVNSITLSSPFATFSFSASASFEVRSPLRIQVEFKEGSLQPPEINSSINLPDNLDIFGQTINLLPIQQSLNPLQDVVANISRAISGQPSLRVPIPGDRTKSWLLTTFLDDDLRISRGDGGLFVLAKEGSPLLD